MDSAKSWDGDAVADEADAALRSRAMVEKRRLEAARRRTAVNAFVGGIVCIVAVLGAAAFYGAWSRPPAVDRPWEEVQEERDRQRIVDMRAQEVDARLAALPVPRTDAEAAAQFVHLEEMSKRDDAVQQIRVREAAKARAAEAARRKAAGQ